MQSKLKKVSKNIMPKKTVELFLKKHNLLIPKNNIIVAFSGGFDSMCLLNIMKQIAKDFDINLIAIHLNHGWRGEESDFEEYRCRDFCKDITFYSEKLADNIPHTETAAREARYAFFEHCADKFNSKTVLTAHNANDNAETIFYRMTKGTGITGLEGINEKRGIYYRPLLNVYRKDIENYCQKNNLTPNNDSSNNDTTYTRNKIRKEIFPFIKKYYPDFEDKLNKLSFAAKETNDILKSKIKPLENYSADEFTALSNNIQNMIVHEFFRKNNLDYDKTKIENLVKTINKNAASKSGKKVSLTKDLWLFVNSKKIEKLYRNSKHSTEISIRNEGAYEFEDYAFLIIKTNKKPDLYPKDEEYTAYVNLDKIDFTLRNRKDGDIIQPLGMKGKQKLKKYLTEKKIPKHEKDNLICLCDNNEVLWVAGYGINEKIKVTKNPTHIIKIERLK